MNRNVSKISCKRGFTLIELLVVVLIIGILAAVAVPQYQKAVVKARFSEAMANLKSIAEAHQACFLEKGRLCNAVELSLDPGISSKYFDYFARSPYEDDGWAHALYKKEELCLCYTREGEFVFSSDHENAECSAKDATFDYATLLGIPEVSYEECGCC